MPFARKGDFVLVTVHRSQMAMHGPAFDTHEWEPGVVAKTTQGNVEKAIIGFGSASTDVSRMSRVILPKKDIPGGDAFALVRAVREVTGEDYPSFSSLDDARKAVKEALERMRKKNPRGNPGRGSPAQPKTVDVFLPMTRARAEAWLRARRIPFTHMRDMFQGVAFRIRRGYVLDFKHEKDKSAPGYNPGFSAKEERQYQDIVRSGRKRYGTRAREIAARTVLKGRRRNPARAKYETTLNGVQVRFFQGYAEDVRYTRAQDGQPYSHVVETDAAELYLCEHPTYGRCLLIVDPSGATPLWG